MDAIILCAGLGTRLRPLTDTVPKPLVPVNGKGTLERALEILPADVTRVIIVVNYLAEQITQRIGTTSHGRAVVYITQDPLDGTGGCVRQVKQQISDLSERFLVICGDDLYAAADLQALVETPDCAILTFPYTIDDERNTKDACRLTPEGYLAGFYRPENGETVSMNTGAYLLDHRWFDTAPILVPGKTTEWSLPHALPELVEKGVRMKAIPATFWMPVGSPEELAAAEKAVS